MIDIEVLLLAQRQINLFSYSANDLMFIKFQIFNLDLSGVYLQ